MCRHKSKPRLELEKVDLISLYQQYTTYEIAEQFNCKYSLVRDVLNKQFNKLEINKIKEIADIKPFNPKPGAWAELKSTQLYKQIIYGRN